MRKSPPDLRKAFIVWFEGDHSFYFTHAKTPPEARWIVIRRLGRPKRAGRGFTLARCLRFPQGDNVPITYELLQKLGYTAMRVIPMGQICTCDLCLGDQSVRKEV